MGTKFFTNSSTNTLQKKFEGIFRHMDIAFFEVLVGFFRASGYFRIQKYLSPLEKVRILVGIDVDKWILSAQAKGLELAFNNESLRQEIFEKLQNDIQNAEYAPDVESGMRDFIRDIASGKIEIRIHKEKNIHAKIYIFRGKTEHQHAGWGAVITGSSNLSSAGLEHNFEFNVELRDHDDVKFALQTFEELWNQSVTLPIESIQPLSEKTYLNDQITPYELYLKFLIEYFGRSIEYDPDSVADLPPGYKKLQYQVDAVNDGFNKLMKHNGFILADVVGLGKTVVSTLIAKKYYFSNGYHTKILIIYPPALESGWKRTIREFQLHNVRFITNGSLHKIKHPEDYDLIIVDEAHKFRSDLSERFSLLQRICKSPRKRPGANGQTRKKVILISATPLNNKPEDIRNQLYLFQDARDSTLEIGNLQAFFRPLIDQYQRLKKITDKSKIKEGLDKIAEQIREKILIPLIVRRTRTDIKANPGYAKDVEDQGLTFPEVSPPQPILYQLPPKLNELYDRTFRLIQNTTTGLQYFRYQAIGYLKDTTLSQLTKAQQAKYQYRKQISFQLAVIMKTLLVKRIDSSFFAFKSSLKRYQRANRAMLTMLENNRVFIAPDLKVSDLIMDGNEEVLEDILADLDDDRLTQVYQRDDFHSTFLRGIERDQRFLDELVAEWELVKEDPKFEKLLEEIHQTLLNPKINPTQKMVLFSESKETTDYLKKRLLEEGFTRILSVNSSNQSELVDVIQRNFDANLPLKDQRNEYDFIITTEVLAEGVNLHRSNVIINYDIPWNATRLMQRIGRVNRLGTNADKIHIFNFFPTEQTEDHIQLNQKAYIKLQAFHSALGEDSQIYSSQEEINSFGLYEKVPVEEKDERLELLMEIRDFRERDPKSFHRIKNLPKRARCGRKDPTKRATTLTYLKNPNRESFFFIHENGTPEILTFVEAARLFRANSSERAISLHHLHHQQVTQAVKSFAAENRQIAQKKRINPKLGPRDQKAVGFLGSAPVKRILGEENKNLLIAARSAIRAGTFQSLPREINKLVKSVDKGEKTMDSIVDPLLHLLKKYPLQEKNPEDPQENVTNRVQPKIILSESFN